MRKKLLTGILMLVIIFGLYEIFINSRIESTFPFSKAKSVELIYYKEAQEGGANLQQISKTPSKKKVKLSKKETEEIFEILYKQNCFMQFSAACYDPRHALIFTNKSDTIGIIEVCLACSKFSATEGIEVPKICDEMVNKLDKFFESKL